MVGGNHRGTLKPTRILLRNFKTGAFFKSATEWTTEQNEALNFEASLVAISVARELGLQNIELLHVSDDGTTIFGTPLKINP